MKKLAIFLILISAMSARADYSFRVFQSSAEAETYLLDQLMIHMQWEPIVYHPNAQEGSLADIATDQAVEVIRSLAPMNNVPSTSPHIIFIDSEDPIGFAINDDENGSTPYLYVLSKVFLKESYAALVGLVAHELSHLMLQYTDDEGVFFPIEYFYFREGPRVVSDPVNVSLTREIRNYVEVQGEASLVNFHNIDELRFESREDHADKIAVKVMKALNVSIDDYNNLLLKHFYEENANCNTASEPSYGSIMHPHHSACWRVWRNRNL